MDVNSSFNIMQPVIDSQIAHSSHQQLGMILQRFHQMCNCSYQLENTRQRHDGKRLQNQGISLSRRFDRKESEGLRKSQ